MKKKLMTMATAGLMALSMVSTSFAGQWKQDSVGYWYQNDDGSYPSNRWQWIDGNNDGTAECYYFDANGYMLANTTTPDDYQVNSDGAWTIDNFTQTKVVQPSNPVDTSNLSDPLTGYNELGVSLAVVDMLENTMEENAAIYGVESQYESSGELFVKYNNGITINYFRGKPDIASAYNPSTILKGLDDSLRNSGDDQDRLNNMKNNGYTDSYSDSIVVITNVGKYQVHWNGGVNIQISIMAKYR